MILYHVVLLTAIVSFVQLIHPTTIQMYGVECCLWLLDSLVHAYACEWGQIQDISSCYMYVVGLHASRTSC